MRFGVSFFPTVRPQRVSAADYYAEALALAEEADRLGYAHVRIVEHYFRPYGGYSPSPIVFLSAAAQRTRRARLMTGAVLPAFNHPIKLAGELAMLDNLSGGRLDAGFARAFLPEEFDAFGVPMDESRARFEEGIEAVVRLWMEEQVTFAGRFHRFGPLTLLPRPLQRPHPPLWGAAVITRESFEWIGRRGMNLMVVPYLADEAALREHVAAYRAAYHAAGHPGREEVQLAYHLYLAETDAQARAEAQAPIELYVDLFKQSAAAWAGRSSAQYRAYEQLTQALDALTYRRMLDEGRVLFGSPATVAERLRELRRAYGEFDLSLSLSFGEIPLPAAQRTLRLFAQEVAPRLQTDAEMRHA